MSSHKMCATSRTRAPSCAQHKSIEKQLGRYGSELRAPVRALASHHERLAQLSTSFPALLVALAWPRVKLNKQAVIQAVIAGEPLSALAAQVGLPMWLRRMPPEMLVAPLPDLPNSSLFRRCIVNHFPRSKKVAARWFANVAFAARWANEPFAIWCANAFAKHLRTRRRRTCDMGLLCLWAWYSSRPGTLGHALMATRWVPEMEFRNAVAAALRWREAVDLAIHLGRRSIEDIWHLPCSIDGYEFVPLRNVEEIEEEACAMENCLRTYGELLANSGSRLWSMRKEGGRVATMEIARAGNSPVPVLHQLCLPRNAEPSQEMWVTAHRWLRAQDLYVCDAPAPDWSESRPDRALWQELWKPYWLAKRQVPHWLPLVPSRDTLADL